VKLDIRTKLVLVSLGLIAASIVILEAYLRPLVEQEIVDGLHTDLLARLALIERDVAPLVAAGTNVSWDDLANDFGARAGLRVTLIRNDGIVLGDSEVAASALPAVENHRDRVEVAAALRGERGFAMRASATVGRRFLYAAIPMKWKGGVVGVVRVAAPLEQLEHAVFRLRRALLVAAGLALAAAVLMSTVAAHLMSAALRGITQAAHRMSAGDLTARTRIGGVDEVGQLGRTLDGLAENLSATLAALRGERDLFGRMLQSMQEGVLVLDRDLRILLVNASLRDMLLLGNDVVGRMPIETIRNTELQSVLDGAATSGEPASGEMEIAGLRARRFMVHATPLTGEPRGLVAVFVDVTEIRRLESMRKDFVANVSHELRTPITAVRSAAETARRTIEKDPPAALRFVDMIERNACRLQELVEDLLELSRIESKQLRLEAEAVDVSPVVEQVLAVFREAVDRKRLRAAAVVPPVSKLVRGDRRAIEQVLTNLVENAVKYCPEGATVTVRITPQGETGREGPGMVRVSVEDTGPGIEPKHLPRLFERFYRADKGRSRDMGGTGLGLSIVKHLVEAMAGKVGVESTPGKGTVFWFTLPIV
jgi:two-component system, OmpR family, phosphate regulon sensor histidine kinase PhoR